MRKWLIELRKSRELNQKDIANSVGITREYYSMIESGARRPSVDNAKKIAEVLEFDWTLFFSKCEKNSA